MRTEPSRSRESAPPESEAAQCTVFEAENPTRREIYIGVTRLPMFETLSMLKAAPPASIRHWNFEDVTNLRSIEFNLTLQEAGRFLEGYARGRGAGWRCIADVPPRRRS